MEPPEEKALIEEERATLAAKGWDVSTDVHMVEGKTQWGVADVIAKSGNTIICVECKYINRTNPTKKRKKVKDQAIYYASWMKCRNPNKIVGAAIHTNEERRILCEVEYKESYARLKSLG
jgi:Holliday junction resolvase